MSRAGGMTSFERVRTSLGGREPDRLPYFLLFTGHGAKVCGLEASAYFRDPEAMAEGQIRLQERYGHDCYYGFSYAAAEAEAWGAEVEFSEEGPPLAASLIARGEEEIRRLEAPQIRGNPPLERILRTIALLRRRGAGKIPVIGVVLSPLSAPVMQLGFGPWLDFLASDSPLLGPFLEMNLDFCLRWGRAQVEAGADLLCLFDPLASSDMLDEPLYRRYGLGSATRFIGAMGVPVATHLASGRALSRLGTLAETGTAAVALSSRDELTAAKRAAGKLGLIGNLDGVLMRRWSREETERRVAEAIEAGGPGGGFILADNHGEIPWSVPETVLDAIGETVRRRGVYPLGGAR